MGQSNVNKTVNVVVPKEISKNNTSALVIPGGPQEQQAQISQEQNTNSSSVTEIPFEITPISGDVSIA